MSTNLKSKLMPKNQFQMLKILQFIFLPTDLTKAVEQMSIWTQLKLTCLLSAKNKAFWVIYHIGLDHTIFMFE